MKTQGRLVLFVSRGRCRSGFTLIELLVVVVILGILIAILLPALARAQSKAKATLCLSQVKQWGLALWMYSDDADEFFPYEGAPGDISAGRNVSAWYNTVSPYLEHPRLMDLYLQGQPPMPGDKSIFLCPTPARRLASPPTVRTAVFLYGFNSRLDPNGLRRFRRSVVLQPENTVLFTENSENQFSSTSGVFTPSRHDSRAALAFVDGHAALIHTNEYRRTRSEDKASVEWSQSRTLYWFPNPSASQ